MPCYCIFLMGYLIYAFYNLTSWKNPSSRIALSRHLISACFTYLCRNWLCTVLLSIGYVLVATLRLIMDVSSVVWVLSGIQNVFVAVLVINQYLTMRLGNWWQLTFAFERNLFYLSKSLISWNPLGFSFQCLGIILITSHATRNNVTLNVMFASNL